MRTRIALDASLQLDEVSVQWGPPLVVEAKASAAGEGRSSGVFLDVVCRDAHRRPTYTDSFRELEDVDLTSPKMARWELFGGYPGQLGPCDVRLLSEHDDREDAEAQFCASRGEIIRGSCTPRPRLLGWEVYAVGMSRGESAVSLQFYPRSDERFDGVRPYVFDVALACEGKDGPLRERYVGSFLMESTRDRPWREHGFFEDEAAALADPLTCSASVARRDAGGGWIGLGTWCFASGERTDGACSGLEMSGLPAPPYEDLRASTYCTVVGPPMTYADFPIAKALAGRLRSRGFSGAGVFDARDFVRAPDSDDLGGYGLLVIADLDVEDPNDEGEIRVLRERADPPAGVVRRRCRYNDEPKPLRSSRAIRPFARPPLEVLPRNIEAGCLGWSETRHEVACAFESQGQITVELLRTHPWMRRPRVSSFVVSRDRAELEFLIEELLSREFEALRPRVRSLTEGKEIAWESPRFALRWNTEVRAVEGRCLEAPWAGRLLELPSGDGEVTSVGAFLAPDGRNLVLTVSGVEWFDASMIDIAARCLPANATD